MVPLLGASKRNDKLMEIKAITLYSTSPTNTIKYEKKLEQWRVIKGNIVMTE